MLTLLVAFVTIYEMGKNKMHRKAFVQWEAAHYSWVMGYVLSALGGGLNFRVQNWWGGMGNNVQRNKDRRLNPWVSECMQMKGAHFGINTLNLETKNVD